ncbi:hypothetical protein EDB85DRAFT_221524 [Lactarius pseudohatsudake]|nr:hypothetical protein EDB85DRAFT_221524 [Lactarius pseudohatsudake]
MYSYRSSTDTKEGPAVRDCPTSSSAEKKNVVDAPYVPTRSARLPSQESMTKEPEPTLSNFRSDSRLLTRCAGDALCRERKDEGAGGGARAQGRGKAVLFLLNKIDTCRPAVSPSLSISRIDLVPLASALTHLKHLCTRTSTLPFLSARPPPVSGSYIAISLVRFWTSVKAASSTRSSAPRCTP